MPDVVQLGRMVKSKYPGVYDDLPDGVVGQKVKAKFPGAYDDFTDMSYTPPTAKPPEQSRLGALAGGIAENITRYGVQPALSAMEAVGSAAGGDFRPLGQMAESAGRGALKLVSAFDPAGNAYEPTVAEQNPRLAELQRQREQRQAQTPAGRYIQRKQVELAAEAARDQTTGNKVARGIGRFIGGAAPVAITGALTGGSLPAMTATTAFQSAAEPENLALNVGLGAAPIPAGQIVRSATNAIRRVFGKGAAQIIEAEAAGAALPPAGGAVSPTVQRAMTQFEQAVAEINASGLSPAEKAAALQTSIQVIGREASGIHPVSEATRRGYPPAIQEFPVNPNPIQVAGELPGVPGIAAEMGTGASIAAPQIAGRMAGMARTPTSPVSLPQLRAEFPGLSKQQFDDEVLKLAEEGQVAVHRHDAPGLLSEAERNAMVKVGDDYYTAATVRGPSVSAPLDLNATVAQAAKSIPTPKMERFKDELLGLLSLPKSLRSTLDVSYPFRQGAILLLRPFQWRQSRKVIADMFRAFKTKNFEAINEAIANHPRAARMETAGVHILEPGGGPLRGEEAFSRPAGAKIAEFVTQKAGKYVGIKQSDQAFTTAGNVQRVEAFNQYANTIDKAGLSPEQAALADKAAAQWVNITTGRGSLGKTIDKAFEALNYAYFSPRYVASRLNILNPVMYLRNAVTPGGRVILRQQMADLVQYAGTVATTLYLAKQAGADVTFDLHSPDFIKIKFGTWRYDMGAGLSQLMRMMFRVGEDFNRARRGEKPEFGKSAIDIGETFLSYKLSPPAGVFRDFIKQRTAEGKPFTAGGAAADLAAPMQWADFVDAYQKEAWGGVLKTLPGAAGVGVQNYEQSPVDAAIERAKPLFTELQRLGKQVSDLRKQTKQEFKNGKWVATENEDDASFNARVQQFGQNYTLYGLQLLDSPRFRQAPDSVRVLALDALNERAKKLTTAEFPFPELVLDANTLMDSAEASAAKRNPASR